MAKYFSCEIPPGILAGKAGENRLRRADIDRIGPLARAQPCRNGSKPAEADFDDTQGGFDAAWTVCARIDQMLAEASATVTDAEPVRILDHAVGYALRVSVQIGMTVPHGKSPLQLTASSLTRLFTARIAAAAEGAVAKTVQTGSPASSVVPDI